MTSNYLNVEQCLTDLLFRQTSVERYLGLKAYVDWVGTDDQNIQVVAPVNQWQTQVLLISQKNSEENGLYVIDEKGHWYQQQDTIEIGNIVVVKNHDFQSISHYYQLLQNQFKQRIWQGFSLSELSIQ